MQIFSDFSRFFCPNLNFSFCRKFDPEHLITLFMGLLLEFKIIIVCESTEQLDCMPIVFESLFELIKPVDKHICTQVPQIVSYEMCELI